MKESPKISNESNSQQKRVETLVGVLLPHLKRHLGRKGIRPKNYQPLKPDLKPDSNVIERKTGSIHSENCVEGGLVPVFSGGKQIGWVPSEKPESDTYESISFAKKKISSFAISGIFSAVLHILFFLRDKYPFNKLVQLRANSSYIELIGFLVILYIVPAIVYFLLIPEREFHDFTSQSRTTIVATFIGVMLVLCLIGLVMGGLASFVIGIIFY